MGSCEECGLTFHNRSNLNRHMARKHGKEIDEDSDGDEDPVEDTENISEVEEEEEEEDEPRVDVWERIIKRSVKHGYSLLEAYKDKVIFCRSLDDDTTHGEVMSTLEKAQDDEGMDFEEVLDYAVDKRKFKIMKELNKYNEQELFEMRKPETK